MISRRFLALAAFLFISGGVSSFDDERMQLDCSYDIAILPNPCSIGVGSPACVACMPSATALPMNVSVTYTQASGIALRDCVFLPGTRVGKCSTLPIRCTRTYVCEYGLTVPYTVCAPFPPSIGCNGVPLTGPGGTPVLPVPLCRRLLGAPGAFSTWTTMLSSICYATGEGPLLENWPTLQ